MKRNLTTLGALAVVAALASTSYAGKLTNSKHDLGSQWGSYGSPSGVGDEICQPCHTPHNGRTDIEEGRYLWNHQSSTPDASFKLYTAVHTDTRASTQGDKTSANPVLDPGSKMCLSCHDGATALDAFGGRVGTGQAMKMTSAGGKALGTDLSNDHPIGIGYPGITVGTDGALVYNPDRTKNLGYINPTLEGWGTTAPSGDKVVGGGLHLVEIEAGRYGVGCTTCHTPHSNDYGYLKMPNKRSQLCLKCHDK